MWAFGVLLALVGACSIAMGQTGGADSAEPNSSSPSVVWTQVFPAASPDGKVGPAMAYDAARGQIVLFGGIGGGPAGTAFAETWTWDGTTWTQKFPVHSPPGRGWSAMAYDAAHAQTLLFGGIGANSTWLSDTWLWNGTDWTQASPATNPPARIDYAMAYDALHGLTLMTGEAIASNGYGPLSSMDTWAWDGGNWAQRSPATSPTGR